MINPAKLLKLKGAIDIFTQNHPKFPKFLGAVKQNGLHEGTVIDITVTTEDGKTLSSNIKLKESDVLMFEEMVELFKKSN